jgi:ferric-dicitrate binding protein FerR (iron transport regulator)
MSEDRLDRALEEMTREDVDARTLEAARTRVWAQLTHTTAAACGEFRPDFRSYLAGTLGDSRRALVEDHLGRCPACRTYLSELRGDRRVIAMPARSSRRRIRWGTLAAAAALILGAAYLGRDGIDTLLAPGGPQATVVSASGGLYRLPDGELQPGAAIGGRESIRTGPGAHAVLRLADGSTIDVNERTEFFVTAAWSGQTIHLQRGDIIIKAARQRRGHLRVTTRDSIASVKGTVFAVSAGIGGSVVSVVEGAVAVNQPGREVLLHPGEQAASIPALASSVADAIAWSPEREAYLELLGSFAKIERELAEMSPGPLRTNSALLPLLPAGAFVYGAVPNLGGQISQALTLADQQATENAAFGTWWTSETARELRQIVSRIQSVSSLLGDEIVFCVAQAGAGTEVPMVIARVQPGKRMELASALEGLLTAAEEPALPYSVSDELMLVSDSPAHLAWALGHLGQGSGSRFASAIADRYRRGAGWVIGMDAAPIVRMAAADDAPPVEFAAMIGLKYLFLEQRAPAGTEENEVTLLFEGERTGIASWLADSGSGGAAEYLPADALVAGYVSIREPWRLFQEFAAVMTRENQSFGADLAEVEEKLGAGFIGSFTAAMGTEAAFALQGFSVNGPSWVLAALANSPPVIDRSIRTLVEAANAELAREGQDQRIVYEQQAAGGRTWHTMKPARLPFSVTWTYDRGYMVLASDRAAAERAIATRGGGFQLVWSPEFLGQLPSSAGMHPSAFFWLNAKGALDLVSALARRPALTELLAGRRPVLVVVDGAADRIHAASQTRITGLIMDAMLLESLSQAGLGRQPQDTGGQ